jgi:hypothetical protein
VKRAVALMARSPKGFKTSAKGLQARIWHSLWSTLAIPRVPNNQIPNNFNRQQQNIKHGGAGEGSLTVQLPTGTWIIRVKSQVSHQILKRCSRLTSITTSIFKQIGILIKDSKFLESILGTLMCLLLLKEMFSNR